MKISKKKLKTIIKESFEKILNESDFDLERIGRERSKRMTAADLSTGVNRIEAVFSKYRSMYPGILEHDDIAFIDFIINTNKLVYRDDHQMLSAKRKDLMRNAEKSKENDGTATGIGRMMFEGEESDEDGIWAAQNSAAMEEWRNFIDNKKGLNPSNLSGKIKDQGFDEIKSNINLGALFALLEILFKFDPNSSTGTRDPKKRNTVIFKSIIGDPGSAWKEKYNTSAGAGKKSDFDSKN